MLESLHIRNLALVSALDMDFSSGLNVITGETGAGKSLIIGAIQLIAGGRATPSSIRKGEKNCEAAAIVNLKEADPSLVDCILDRLQQAGLPPPEEHKIILRRVITESGSRAYVNATPVTVGFLRDLGDLLVDIHGPHDNQSLLRNAKQLQLLDAFAKDQPLLDQCLELYTQAEDIRKELDQIHRDGLNPEEADLLRHQLREIKEADLKPGEDEELFKKYKLAESANRIMEVSSQTAEALADGDNSILDQLGTILRSLRELESLDPDEGPQFPEQLVNIYDQIQTLAEQLRDYAQHLELDPQNFQILEERLEVVQKMKRKYGPALIDVFESQARIRTRLQNILGKGDKIKQLRSDLQNTQTKLLEACKKLSDARTKAAPPLAKAITEKLKCLGFNKSAFEINVQDAPVGPTGANAVEYLFAPNLGEDLMPLRQIASSGETARIMLAIKTVLSQADSIPILVFDEIDANVGGRVAATVADELNAVAQHHQVFSITHLPQIAAAAATHFLVEKHVEHDRTVTAMTPLTHKAKLAEIIRMLGAPADSPAAEKHAQELIRNAQKGQP